MTRKNIDIEETRQELERIYSSLPPMRLIYQILIGGTIGTFLAVLTVRVISPNRLPQLTFQSTINKGQNHD